MEIFYNTLFPQEEIFFPTSDFTVLHSDPASPYATVRETKGFEPGTVSCILPPNLSGKPCLIQSNIFPENVSRAISWLKLCLVVEFLLLESP